MSISFALINAAPFTCVFSLPNSSGSGFLELIPIIISVITTRAKMIKQIAPVYFFFWKSLCFSSMTSYDPPGVELPG